MLNEQQISQADSALLRYTEAKYLHGQFRAHCGPPRDSYFHMIVYFDAFLFCFISIEEMINEESSNSLNSKDVFKFLKAARNVTTHHSILAAPPGAQTAGFQRPFGRIGDVSIGVSHPYGSAKLQVNLDVFERVFDTAADRWPRGRASFAAGKAYLTRKQSEGLSEIFIEDVMKEGLQAVAEVLGYEL